MSGRIVEEKPLDCNADLKLGESNVSANPKRKCWCKAFLLKEPCRVSLGILRSRRPNGVNHTRDLLDLLDQMARVFSLLSRWGAKFFPCLIINGLEQNSWMWHIYICLWNTCVLTRDFDFFLVAGMHNSKFFSIYRGYPSVLSEPGF